MAEQLVNVMRKEDTTKSLLFLAFLMAFVVVSALTAAALHLLRTSGSLDSLAARAIPQATWDRLRTGISRRQYGELTAAPVTADADL